MQRAAGFYTTVLGFTLVRRAANGGGEFGVRDCDGPSRSATASGSTKT